MHRPPSHAAAIARHVRAAFGRPRTGAKPVGEYRCRARVRTERSERYAKQLCSHAARMTSEAHWTPPSGVIEFPDGGGACRITAEPDCLLLALEAASPDGLARLRRIVAADVERFGVREGLTVTWQDGD
jgi:hypothetical protein